MTLTHFRAHAPIMFINVHLVCKVGRVYLMVIVLHGPCGIRTK